MSHDEIDEAPGCIRGCIRKGSDEPLRARHGPYCNRCYYQYLRALDVAAELVEHVTSLISYKARQDGDKVSTSRDAPVPFNLDAFHDANETYRRLLIAATVFAQHLRIPGPQIRGRVWRNHHGKVVGFRRGIPAHTARRETATVTAWLTNHLDQILTAAADDLPLQEALDKWRDALRDVYRINAKWPREPKPRYSDMPCPDDGARLAIYPPAAFMDDERIICEECGRHFQPENYEFYLRLFQGVQKEHQRAARTARHLYRKHIAPKEGTA